MKLMDYLWDIRTQYSPRVHANGFLQIDITPSVRLHVWGHGGLPKQKVPTPIHDHAFGFQSRILLGALEQREYMLGPAGDPEAVLVQPHRARIATGENTSLEPEGPPMEVWCKESRILLAGDEQDSVYFMEEGEFHESVPVGRAVSIIIKQGKTLSQGGAAPLILVPFGLRPSNEFDRHALAPHSMFEIAEEVISMDPEAVAAGILWALRQEALLTTGKHHRILSGSL